MVEVAKTLMTTGIPVEVSRLDLDFWVVSCDEEGLRTFVRTITEGAAGLVVSTGWKFGENPVVDADGQDCRDRIRAITKTTASVRDLFGFNMGGFLELCSSPLNREAMWRGLFEDVLSREKPLELLQFQHGVQMTDADVQCMRECAARWREAHPGRQLRVTRLKLHFGPSARGPVKHILDTFDDLEAFTLHQANFRGAIAWGNRHFARLFRFPSLQSVKLSKIGVESMNVFDPSIVESGLPTKPALHELIFQGCQILRPDTLRDFLAQLKPAPANPSQLSQSLRVLRLVQATTQNHLGSMFDSAMLASLNEVLATNRTLTEVQLSVNNSDPRAESVAHKLLTDDKRRVLLARDNHYQSQLARARHVAFLSVLHGRDVDEETVGPRAWLDSSLLGQIFEFSAPSIHRMVRFRFLDE